MQTRLEKYLQARKFVANPFGTTNAEQEQERLPSFFVRVPWFDWLVGDPQHPESLVLFAPRGYGKTSHRLEVERLAGDPTREQRALVVVLNDVNVLIQEGIENISINTYLSLIRRKTLESLVTQLKRIPERLQAFKQDVDSFARLVALLQIYAPRQILALEGLERSTPDLVQIYKQIDLSPREWLKEELSPLVSRAGFASVYVLIDGVDESSITRDNQEVIFRLLSPLLDAPGLLQGCGFAFKFFLPASLAEPMLQQQVGRLDRIPYRSIAWTEANLLEMLSQRLKSFSFDQTISISYVQSFQDLCDADFNVDLQLVQAAKASPRRMIDLARQIIERHCDRFTSVDDQISTATILSVLQIAENVVEQPAQIVHEQPIDSTVTPDTEPSDHSRPPPLFLDQRGDIWLGNRRLEDSLPGILRTCMDYLWQHRDRTVRYEELQQVLWDQDDLANLANPKDSCNKHIRRLRELLEPDHPGSRTYIDVQSRVGYVLRNTREEKER